MTYNQNFLQLLKDEVKPALGCTEPMAVALAVARTTEAISGEIKCLEVIVSRNIFKNAMGVTIPHTKDKGILMAAALGAAIRDSSKEFEVLENITPNIYNKAVELINRDLIKTQISRVNGIYIQVKAETDCESAELIVEDSHGAIKSLVVNGVSLANNSSVDTKAQVDIKDYLIEDIIEFARNIRYEDIEFLEQGVEMNNNAVAIGKELTEGYVGTGFSIMYKHGFMSLDPINKVRMAVASACDARMSGMECPIMSTMGSGNQGIGAILPVAIMAKELESTKEKMLRALVISHLITGYVKQHIGKLTPVCGCAVAAGAGAAAGVAWLLSEKSEIICGAIKNILANLTGMICDGAKGSCALKLSTSSGEAVIAALLAHSGTIVSAGEGIVAETPEETIQNLKKISFLGMERADDTILDIMLENTGVKGVK